MKRLFLTILAAALAVLPSCMKLSNAQIECTRDVQLLTYKGGVVETYVTSNAPWKAKCSDGDVKVEPKEGKGDQWVIVTLPMNEYRETKSTSIVFTAQIDSAFKAEFYTDASTLVITREAHPFVYCEVRSKKVGPQAAEYRFSVTSNYPWSLSKVLCDGEECETVQVSPLSHDINNVVVKVKIPANEGYEEKTYEVVLVLDDFPDDTLTLKMIQAPEE